MKALILNQHEAVEILRANLTPRQLDLEALERFAEGTYADGRPDWFTDGNTPLWERKPCVIDNIALNAILSNVDLVVGESRFPSISSNPGEDDSEASGLDEKESKRVDRALTELHTRVRFHTIARQALQHSMSSRSVATIAGVRNGKPFLELARARWCEPPVFDANGDIERLELRYPYIQLVKRLDGQWEAKVFLYRRIIDAVSDTTFLPVPADVSGREPPPGAWVEDPQRTVKHGLGFCPVHWYAHMRECSTVADFDGKAIHELLLDEIQGLDFTLSQRHRSALFCGDPQIVETGVQPGYNPSSSGTTAIVPASQYGGKVSSANPLTSHYVDTTRRTARVKSPGAIWQYESKDIKVEYLTLPPGSLEALTHDAEGLRDIICEGLAYAPLDAKSSKLLTALSSKAIESLRARQFDRCDKIRDDFGPCWILPVNLLVLRVCIATRVPIPAVAAVKKTLAQYVSGQADAPMLFLHWRGAYVRPDAAEEQQVVNTSLAAKEGGLITLRMAVQKIAPIYGIANIDQAVAAIEAERAENQKKAMAIAKATAPAEPEPGAPPKTFAKPVPPKGDAKEAA